MSLLDYITEMSQVNDEIFKLDGDEYERMADLFNDLGVNIDLITVDDISENTIAGMTDTERFKKGIAIQVDRGTHNSLRDMIDIGMEAKDWYYEISETIYGSLGESDGCLFLMLLASTSPRNMLTKNFSEASVIYEGFKEDLNNNEELLNKFLEDDFKANEFRYDEGSEYWDLQFVQAMGNYGLQDIGAKINNIKKSMAIYMESGGNLTKESTAQFLSNRFNPYSKTIKGIIDFSGNVLRKSKVYNFTLNLLYPDHSVSIRNKKWYFVTIDTWMIRAMYPYLPDKEKDKIMSHNAKYLYAQEKIISFANEVGLMPHQVQASVWVAKLKEAGKSVDSFSKSIEKKKQDLEKANGELSIIGNDLKSIIKNIYVQSSINPSNEPTELAQELGDEAPF